MSVNRRRALCNPYESRTRHYRQILCVKSSSLSGCRAKLLGPVSELKLAITILFYQIQARKKGWLSASLQSVNPLRSRVDTWHRACGSRLAALSATTHKQLNPTGEISWRLYVTGNACNDAVIRQQRVSFAQRYEYPMGMVSDLVLSDYTFTLRLFRP